MTSARFEMFLAQIYTDSSARAAFLADRSGEARRFGLSEEEADAVAKIDRRQLESAARSYASKRRNRPRGGFRILFDPGHIRYRIGHVARLCWALTKSK